MTKACYKCKKSKDINQFYVHPRMRDGHLGKCKKCTINDSKNKNGLYKRKCVVCKNTFRITGSSIGRGTKCCSRKCYLVRQMKIMKREDKHHSWKGDYVGYNGLHKWVERKLGKPKKCDNKACNGKCKWFDWARKTDKYKRELNNWIRLCRSCHLYYDRRLLNKIKIT